MGNGHRGVVNMGRADTYGYDSDDLAFFERFTLEPVEPTKIESHLNRGKHLSTLDIPTYLDRQLVAGAETGTALYRLVQLFGTPNVPGRTAGASQRERETTTWQYLFQVTFDREGNGEEIENAPEEFLLSVYDYKTNISTGLSAWHPVDEEKWMIREPTDDLAACPEVSPPSDDFLISVVQLVLNMIEESVPATFKGLWI
jgi:hypothetical protein